MPSPNIQQGQLNRLLASVSFPSNPSLNVSPSFMAREMVRINFDGAITTFIQTATGVVVSPEPYQIVTITVNLSKAQGLAQLYENFYANNSYLGDCVVRPDATPLSPFTFQNCAIENVEALQFNGETTNYNITIRGYRPINNSLWG